MMNTLFDMSNNLMKLADMGGPVLLFIVGLILLLWLLLIERLIYYRTALRVDMAQCQSAWQQRNDRQSRRARHVRMALLANINGRIDRFVPMIKTLVALAPLFGLLGTVTGMVGVFEAMAIADGGSARAMSSGVSRATIPTMAGMVAALSGLIGMTGIDRLGRRAKSHLESSLLMDETKNDASTVN
jgi:biopolymer transport protein ExbB